MILLALSGCAMSPVPKDIAQRKAIAHTIRNHVEETVQPGDLLFRRGYLDLCGGLVEFGSLLKSLTGSTYTHVAVVQRKVDGEVVVVDVGTHGLQRLFLVDWLTQDSEQFAVLRVKPQYHHFIDGPGGVLENLRALLQADPVYDAAFQDTPIDLSDLDANQQARAKVMKSVYCTEPADWSYRAAGMPLAEKIRIRDFKGVRRWPNRWFWGIAACGTKIDTTSRVALPGGEELGLASSGLLYVVWSSDQTHEIAKNIRAGTAPRKEAP